MKYDAVIFDLFGTLVRSVEPARYSAMLETLADALGAPRERFSVQWRTTIHERESGQLGGLEDVLRANAAASGTQPSADQVEQARDLWLAFVREWLTPREDTLEVLRHLNDRGLGLGLLSNCSAEVPPIWPTTPFGPLFDATVFSCQAGAMKPEPRLYAEVSDALGVTPERCVYVGDGGARELTGAAAMGMHAVLLRVPGEEHTWFDNNYRQDAIEWQGTAVASLSELRELI